ncbi:MAG TPA: HXXEE domain-containing protein [Anaerolineales bacterium]|nr:HXXEE domain-containing protein [Anaerolineales bacterium]
MISRIDSIPFDRLLWLVPVFFALHNLEEAPLMERWSRRLPLKIHPVVTTRQFTLAVTFLTLAGFLVTYFAVEYLQDRLGTVLVLAIQAILLFNALIPHIATTIRFRMYSPGVMTAVLITLPFSCYLFRRAVTENILTWTQFWILLGIAPFAMVIFAYISLQIGKAFDR